MTYKCSDAVISLQRVIGVTKSSGFGFLPCAQCEASALPDWWSRQDKRRRVIYLAGLISRAPIGASMQTEPAL